jgi:type 1 glutamine amidotransferase
VIVEHRMTDSGLCQRRDGIAMTQEDVAEHHRNAGPRGNGSTRWPERGEKLRVLVVTRGHPFPRDPFFAVFERNHEIEWAHVEHPAAQYFFTPRLAREFDCYVLYDMPGIEFKPGAPPVFFDPPDDFKTGLHEMTRMGAPFVVLHHAMAAWPAWPEWAEFVGGQFLYQPMPSRGNDLPDSGYRLDVAHTISPVSDHPITEGIEPFELTDELYLAPIFEDSITPLFRSDFEFVDSNFYSARRALEGKINCRDDWSHPPGSNIVGWVKKYQRSPIAYLQFGDGPSAYENPVFQRILANAIRWAASEAARNWADSDSA